MIDRNALPDYKRPARPLRGHRRWLSYRTLGKGVPMPIAVKPKDPAAYEAEVIRRCATAGHPMGWVQITKKPMRLCYCWQICCEVQP